MEKVDRPIRYIVVHCDYTKPSMNTDIDFVRKIHVDDNGWRDVGYNYFIRRDGTVQEGRSLKLNGAHTLGRNTDSIGICIAGGMSKDGKPEDNVTPEQMMAVFKLFKEAKEIYPNIQLSGHNQWNKKPCPCFDVRDYAAKHGIKKTDVYHEDPLVELPKS